MPVPVFPSRSRGVPGRTAALLAVLAMALGAAFVAAPRVLAAGGAGDGFAGQDDLIRTLRQSFADYWSSGDRHPPPDLERVVDYWFGYHLAKAAIAAMLLIVLVALGARVWRAFLRAGGPSRVRRAGLVSAGVLVTMLGVLALVTVMANVQGAVAPLASLLPMLTAGNTDARVAGALDQVRRQLAGSPGGHGRTSPALEVMLGDFARYHAAMAVMAAVVAISLIGACVVLWKSFVRTPRSGRRTRRLLGSFGVLTALLSLAMIVLAVANAGIAADPAPAFLAFFEGGW